MKKYSSIILMILTMSVLFVSCDKGDDNSKVEPLIAKQECKPVRIEDANQDLVIKLTYDNGLLSKTKQVHQTSTLDRFFEYDNHKLVKISSLENGAIEAERTIVYEGEKIKEINDIVNYSNADNEKTIYHYNTNGTLRRREILVKSAEDYKLKYVYQYSYANDEEIEEEKLYTVNESGDEVLSEIISYVYYDFDYSLSNIYFLDFQDLAIKNKKAIKSINVGYYDTTTEKVYYDDATTFEYTFLDNDEKSIKTLKITSSGGESYYDVYELQFIYDCN